MTVRNRQHLFLFLPVVMLLMLTVQGCGFKPLYGQKDGLDDVTADLKNVYVASIPERFGQQIRLALQERMASDGPEAPHTYKLIVKPSLSAEAVDIHGDNTTGRTRMVGLAHWQLLTIEQTPRLLSEGDTRTLDGFSSVYEQYFAETLNMESAEGRIAQNLAEQITQQVAIWFKTKVSSSAQIHTGYYDKNSRAYYPVPAGIPESTEEAIPMQQEGQDAVPDLATGRTPINTQW